MLKFSKMHGLGNDFVVIDAIHQAVDLTPEQLRFIADRRRGVGCDQILLVEKPQQTEVDFCYRIFNADGSEVAQCGNGARCFARFVRDKGLTDKDTIAVETASGVIYPTLESDGTVKVNMGPPVWEPARIPLLADVEQPSYTLTLASGETVTFGAVSMGNPHAVIQVADVQMAPVEQWGPEIESHACFPERVNVGFMQILDSAHIRLRVFERGTGETQACGTGACAAVVTGIIQQLLDPFVSVTLPGGTLWIRWDGEGQDVWMTGPAEHVFDGEIAWTTLKHIQSQHSR